MNPDKFEGFVGRDDDTDWSKFKRTGKSNYLNRSRHEISMIEFSVAARAASVIRKACIPRGKHMIDATFVARIQAVIRAILSKAPGEMGMRHLQLGQHLHELEGMDTHENGALHQSLRAPFELKLSPTTDQITLAIRPQNGDWGLLDVPGATHFRIVLTAAIVTDYPYDRASHKHQPAHPDLIRPAVATESALMAIDQPHPGLTLTLCQPHITQLPADAYWVIGVGIEYIKPIKNQPFVLTAGTAMAIYLRGLPPTPPR